MFKRILNCEYDFVSPWWDDVSLNAKDLVSKAKMRLQSIFADMYLASITSTEKKSPFLGGGRVIC